MNHFKREPFSRFFALLLVLTLTLPGNVLALREIQTVDSGLEEKELAAALRGPAPVSQLSSGLEETYDIRPDGRIEIPRSELYREYRFENVASGEVLLVQWGLFGKDTLDPAAGLAMVRIGNGTLQPAEMEIEGAFRKFQGNDQFEFWLPDTVSALTWYNPTASWIKYSDFEESPTPEFTIRRNRNDIVIVFNRVVPAVIHRLAKAPLPALAVPDSEGTGSTGPATGLEEEDSGLREILTMQETERRAAEAKGYRYSHAYYNRALPEATAWLKDAMSPTMADVNAVGVLADQAAFYNNHRDVFESEPTRVPEYIIQSAREAVKSAAQKARSAAGFLALQERGFLEDLKSGEPSRVNRVFNFLSAEPGYKFQNPADMIPALVESLKSDVDHYRWTAAQALANNGWQPDTTENHAYFIVAQGAPYYDSAAELGRPAIPALLLAMRNPDFKVGGEAKNALVTRIGQETIPALIEVMKNQRDRSAAPSYAIMALGELKATEAVSVLRQYLDLYPQGEYQNAIRALGQIGGALAFETLVDKLQYGDFAIKIAVSRTLGKMGNAAAIPYLAALLQNKAEHEEVLVAAGQAIDKIRVSAVPGTEGTGTTGPAAAGLEEGEASPLRADEPVFIEAGEEFKFLFTGPVQIAGVDNNRRDFQFNLGKSLDAPDHLNLFFPTTSTKPKPEPNTKPEPVPNTKPEPVPNRKPEPVPNRIDPSTKFVKFEYLFGNASFISYEPSPKATPEEDSKFTVTIRAGPNIKKPLTVQLVPAPAAGLEEKGIYAAPSPAIRERVVDAISDNPRYGNAALRGRIVRSVLSDPNLYLEQALRNDAVLKELAGLSPVSVSTSALTGWRQSIITGWISAQMDLSEVGVAVVAAFVEGEGIEGEGGFQDEAYFHDTLIRFGEKGGDGEISRAIQEAKRLGALAHLITAAGLEEETTVMGVEPALEAIAQLAQENAEVSWIRFNLGAEARLPPVEQDLPPLYERQTADWSDYQPGVNQVLSYSTSNPRAVTVQVEGDTIIVEPAAGLEEAGPVHRLAAMSPAELQSMSRKLREREAAVSPNVDLAMGARAAWSEMEGALRHSALNGINSVQGHWTRPEGPAPLAFLFEGANVAWAPFVARAGAPVGVIVETVLEAEGMRQLFKDLGVEAPYIVVSLDVEGDRDSALGTLRNYFRPYLQKPGFPAVKLVELPNDAATIENTLRQYGLWFDPSPMPHLVAVEQYLLGLA